MIIQVDDFVKDRRDASDGISLAIQEAIKQRASTLQFGAGEYNLLDDTVIDTESIAHDDGCGDIHQKDCHILLRNTDNLTICGSDTGKTVLTGFNSGAIQQLLPSILWAEDCRNLVIKNLCFSRKPQTAFCAVVERIENDSIYIELLSPENTPDELGAYCMNRYDIKEKKLLGESLTFGFGYEKRFHKLENQIYRLVDEDIAGKVHAGEGLSFHQSGKTDFLLFFGNCDNLRLENIQIENTNGFAILTQNCETIFADRVKIAPPETQFFTGPRDGWKIYRCAGRIRVENSHFEGVRMDGQNVQSNYLQVEKILDERTLLCRCKYAPIPLKKGSAIYFREEGLQLAMEIDQWQLQERYLEEAKQSTHASAGAVVTGSRNYRNLYRIQLTEKISNRIKKGNLLVAGCWEPVEYVCINSVFRNIAGAGHLIRCRNVVLEGNRYENIMCVGIMLGAELDTHCESDHAVNVTIRKNHFCNIGTKPRYGIYGCACIGIKSQGFHGPFNRNIFIKDNVFEQSKRAIEISDAEGVYISDNVYTDIEEKIWMDKETTQNIVKAEKE